MEWLRNSFFHNEWATVIILIILILSMCHALSVCSFATGSYAFSYWMPMKRKKSAYADCASTAIWIMCLDYFWWRKNFEQFLILDFGWWDNVCFHYKGVKCENSVVVLLGSFLLLLNMKFRYSVKFNRWALFVVILVCAIFLVFYGCAIFVCAIYIILIVWHLLVSCFALLLFLFWFCFLLVLAVMFWVTMARIDWMYRWSSCYCDSLSVPDLWFKKPFL